MKRPKKYQTGELMSSKKDTTFIQNISAMQTYILRAAKGKSLTNIKGNCLGQVVEIIEDKTKNVAQYIILKSDVCFGDVSRFFAIPTSSNFIDISPEKNLRMLFEERDLQLAKVIEPQNLPFIDIEAAQSIFELFNYNK